MQSQYVFLHDALLEALECGDTEVTARDLSNKFKHLSTADLASRTTGIEEEFRKLTSTIHHEHTCSNASLPSNRTKNRFQDGDTFPCEWNSTG